MEITNLPSINLYDIPLIALARPTRTIIEVNLNRTKVIPSEKDLPRDWKGLVHLTGLSQPAGDNPTSQLLSDWETKITASLGLLNQFLGELDRWDIVDDIQDLISRDAREFLDSKKGEVQESINTDSQVLTLSDTVRLNRGLPPQRFDALLLYADEDRIFAKSILERLENDHGLTLCLKESLVGGLQFEHQGIIQLISERCRRVIIIVSNNFLHSPVNRFFVLFSQSLSIEKGQRIIIPCMYEREKITLPVELSYMFKLDYYRATLRSYDFWQKLSDSIGPPTSSQLSLRNQDVMIQEIANVPEENESDSNSELVDENEKKGGDMNISKEIDFQEPFKSVYFSEQVASPEIEPSYPESSTSCQMRDDSNSLESLDLTFSSTISICPSKKKHLSKSPARMFKNMLRIGSKSSKKSIKNKEIALKACN